MAKIRKTTHKEGARTVVCTDCAGGITDEVYYYNLIDYEGDMSDFVNITRHSTLAAGVAEAKRFAMDRKWAGPGVSTIYAGMPPQIIRTVKFIELHRVEVTGPMPQNPTLPRQQMIRDSKGGVDYEKIEKMREQDFKRFWDQFEEADDLNAGKPHPPLK